MGNNPKSTPKITALSQVAALPVLKGEDGV
jgi:hypothetical protein